MENLNLVEILRVGVVGLGFLLALLSYRLLLEEQKKEIERPGILKAIYVFMSFSVVLTLIGLVSEFIGSDNNVKNELLTLSPKDNHPLDYGDYDLSGVCLAAYKATLDEEIQTENIVEILKTRSLSYGWSGGIASESIGNHESPNYFKITDIALVGHAINIYYQWAGGRLTLLPVKSESKGLSFVGYWLQASGSGCVQLAFSPYLTNAIGTWNNGPGTEHRSAYIRLTKDISDKQG